MEKELATLLREAYLMGVTDNHLQIAEAWINNTALPDPTKQWEESQAKTALLRKLQETLEAL